MKISIRQKSAIDARITIPGSKSITNRALLLAALANGTSILSDILISDDTLALINALKTLGTAIELDEKKNVCTVKGTRGVFPKKEASIWCADAGTVARFLFAACAASSGTYHFDGSEQLRARPIEKLIKIVSAQGAKIIPETAKKMPFSLVGADFFKGGEITVDSSETGQFVSALLMAAPFSRSSLLINAKNIVSEPYIKMTCAMMADFGVLVREVSNARFVVPAPQHYTAQNYIIEPDLSTASYFFAAAAVTGGQITIQPISLKKSKQGDAAFIRVLEKMGCKIIENRDGFTVKGSAELKGINVDMRDFSDTMMTLAAIAPFAKTPTTITNIQHARNKESNRISVMRKELEKLAIRAEEGEDWLKIYPGTPTAGVVDSHGDHRIAMAFSIIGLRVPGIEINDAECVNKTCPEFFTLWDRL